MSYNRRPSRRQTVPPRRHDSPGAFVRDLKAEAEKAPGPKSAPAPAPKPKVEAKPKVEPKVEPKPEPKKVEEAPKPAPAPEKVVISMEMTRVELNEAAASIGIEDADKLPNKQSVIDAINEAQGS